MCTCRATKVDVTWRKQFLMFPNEAVCWRNTMFTTELSQGCWLSGYRSYTRIKFRLPQRFSSSLTCTYMSQCIAQGCSLLSSKKWIVYILLNMTMFFGTQSFISPPSFMFVICQSKCIVHDLFVVFWEIHNINHDYVRWVTDLYLSTTFHACRCCS